MGRNITKIISRTLGIAFLVALQAAPVRSQGQEFSAPAVLKPQSEATLYSLMDGLVTVLSVDEGDAFQVGDALVELDCGISAALAAAARAEASSLEAEYASRDSLAKRGGIGETDVAIVRGRMEAAMARAMAGELELDWCEVQAPFDGRVVEVTVNRHEFVQTGQPLMSIVSDEAPFLEIIVPSEWLAWLKAGTRARLRLPAIEAQLDVSVTRIAAVVDPISRTVKLHADLLEPNDGLLPGMSGLVTFEPR